MKNLIDEIKEIISYDDLSEQQKIERINVLCDIELNNYESLLDLREWVAADIIAGNFDIQETTVYTEGYERVCELKRTVTYERREDI